MGILSSSRLLAASEPPEMCPEGSFVPCVQQGLRAGPCSEAEPQPCYFYPSSRRAAAPFLPLSLVLNKGKPDKPAPALGPEPGKPSRDKKRQPSTFLCSVRMDGSGGGLGKHGGDCEDVYVAKKMQLGGKGIGLTEKSSWKKQGEIKCSSIFSPSEVPGSCSSTS